MPTTDQHQSAPDPDREVVHNEMTTTGLRQTIEVLGPYRFWVLQGHDCATSFGAIKMPSDIGRTDIATDGWMGVDVGDHSPVRAYPTQTPTPCRWMRDGDQCYYSGSSLRAMGWVSAFRDGEWDDAAIFRALYRNLEDLRSQIARDDDA